MLLNVLVIYHKKNNQRVRRGILWVLMLEAVTVVHTITAHDDSPFETSTKRSRQVVQHDAIAGLTWLVSPVPELLAHAKSTASTHLPVGLLIPTLPAVVPSSIAPAGGGLGWS